LLLNLLQDFQVFVWEVGNGRIVLVLALHRVNKLKRNKNMKSLLRWPPEWQLVRRQKKCFCYSCK
jgi:hypothetical protein